MGLWIVNDSPSKRRDPWDRWDVLTTPMTESEAEEAASLIDALPGVDAFAVGPGENLRLVWDRESVEMFVKALSAYRDSGGAVPQFIIDNLQHWLENVADN